MAFASCYSLDGIEIPDTVEYVDSTAFLRCYHLSHIKYSDKIAEQVKRALANI